jgi:hypothetical protein
MLMPQTVEIGAFVLGAVLLLLALVSGGFKIFGAEISAAVNKPARVIAFLLGLSFIGLGIWRNSDQGQGVSPGPKASGMPVGPATTDTSVVPTTTGASVVPATNAEIASMSGTWVDQFGTTYQVTQTGNSFSFEGLNPQSGFRSGGAGNVNGRQFTVTYQTNIPSTGSGTGTVSADGLEMTATYNDSAQGFIRNHFTRQ